MLFNVKWCLCVCGANEQAIVILFLLRTAVKVGSVAASPPAVSTPKKHSELKGDTQICADTAVSEQLCGRIPTGFHTRVHKHIRLFSIASPEGSLLIVF